MPPLVRSVKIHDIITKVIMQQSILHALHAETTYKGRYIIIVFTR